MLSRRAYGIFALCAVILAAISFAIVDVSIANASGCIGMSAPCAAGTMPVAAFVFAVVGTISLLASVLPAITWFVAAFNHQQPDSDYEPIRLRPVSFHEEEL